MEIAEVLCRAIITPARLRASILVETPPPVHACLILPTTALPLSHEYPSRIRFLRLISDRLEGHVTASETTDNPPPTLTIPAKSSE